MERALRETLVEGVNTTIELCLEILAAPAFRRGRYDVEFVPTQILSNGEAKQAAPPGAR
jgi:biotin carboxylase